MHPDEVAALRALRIIRSNVRQSVAKWEEVEDMLGIPDKVPLQFTVDTLPHGCQMLHEHAGFIHRYHQGYEPDYYPRLSAARQAHEKRLYQLFAGDIDRQMLATLTCYVAGLDAVEPRSGEAENSFNYVDESWQVARKCHGHETWKHDSSVDAP